MHLMQLDGRLPGSDYWLGKRSDGVSPSGYELSRVGVVGEHVAEHSVRSRLLLLRSSMFGSCFVLGLWDVGEIVHIAAVG